MYKLLGLILVMFSSCYLFVYRLIIYRNTYTTLKDTVKLLHILKNNIHTGKTYPQIISQISTIYSKDFSFKSAHLFFDKLNIDKKIKSELTRLFDILGQNDISNEKEYLNNVISQFDFEAAQFKQIYDSNIKSNVIAGLSTGRIICIVII